jgi:hypothetical protein
MKALGLQQSVAVVAANDGGFEHRQGSKHALCP